MTLEELGYKFIERVKEKKFIWELYENGKNKLFLDNEGDVNVWHLQDAFLNQKLHKAIALKMKELGWWK